MHPAALALLVLWLAGLAWFVRADMRDYAAFRSLADTGARQRRYRAWVAKAFALFVVGALATLAALGRLDAVWREPSELAGLTRALRAVLPARIDPSLLGGVVAGATLGVVASVVLAQRTGGKARPLGDVEPLMPRNGAEAGWAALLSLNAGIGEELSFRLALPLVATLALGNAIAGLIVAAAAFGLVHLYQGWIGVAATLLVGLGLAALYLWTGSLAAPMALHVLIDLVGLVARPTLAGALARR